MKADVVVVGAGHAGSEAALASARMGCAVVLVNRDRASVARMSCNPAIGGLAKGQLVREIDALGGEMAKVADRTGIQFRMLNTTKGPAVRSPRVQSDRHRYAAEMLARLESQPGLTLMEGTITDIEARDGKVTGVLLDGKDRIAAPVVIVTTGTFLNGKIHVGFESRDGGRLDEAPSRELASSLAGLGLEIGRLKTGTPPRIHRDSVDHRLMEEQHGDNLPTPFSFGRTSIPLPQLNCHVTRTNEETHRIIRDSFDRSPLFTGRIKGVGPRYCPSIEDKVHRFPEREGHRVYVEPEGLDTEAVYLNGVSTSLPLEVQERIVRSMDGLARAEILRPGYAVEYDFVPSCQLGPSLETLAVKGLYLAGQINGTSGYEEAAAQGLVAGINAACALSGREPFVLKRSEAYIGVLVDDLVIRSPLEPYRMFTSLAEYRLILRHDNADRRLTRRGRDLGLIGEERFSRFLQKEEKISRCRKVLEQERKGGISLEQILRRPEVGIASLTAENEALQRLELAPEEAEQVEIDVKYEGYVRRQESSIEKMSRLEGYPIPGDLDFQRVSHLKPEAREKLARLRPATLGQASRIAGVTPADLSVLMTWLGRRP